MDGVNLWHYNLLLEKIWATALKLIFLSIQANDGQTLEIEKKYRQLKTLRVFLFLTQDAPEE